MRCATLIALTAGLLTVLVCPPAAAQDRIDMKTGRPVIGKVQSEDYRKVVIKGRKGGEKSIPSDQVLDIARDDAPDTYRNGRVHLLKGDLPNARKVLQLAIDEAKVPWVKEYASFYLAEALRASGRYADAIRVYKSVATLNKQSRFLSPVRLGTARCLSATGKIKQAVSELDAHVKEVDSLALPVPYKLEAQMMLGRLLGRQNKHAEAATAFEAVVRAAESLISKAKGDEAKGALQHQLLAGKRDFAAACIKAKQFGRAESTYATIAKSYVKDPVAQAIAAIGKAEVNLGKGKVDLARVQLTDVLAVHFAAESELPRAIWLLAEAYQKLEEKGENGAEKLRRRYLQYLVEHYPGSDWATEARKTLNLK